MLANSKMSVVKCMKICLDTMTFYRNPVPWCWPAIVHFSTNLKFDKNLPSGQHKICFMELYDQNSFSWNSMNWFCVVRSVGCRIAAAISFHGTLWIDSGSPERRLSDCRGNWLLWFNQSSVKSFRKVRFKFVNCHVVSEVFCVFNHQHFAVSCHLA